jgi:single-strand DNA-binding protein
MASSNINRVVLTGNLTHDPDLRSTSGGTPVCNLRIASNARRKDASSGEWVDKTNYFDVVVWGAQGENVARYLTKGRGVAIDGRLDWREYETEGGSKRQAVQIIADHVEFLAGQERAAHDEAGQGAPTATPPDDDIPF